MNREVFTIFEATAALYLAGEDGEPSGDAVYLGCLNGLRMECDYEEERVVRHGRAHASVHHKDENHVISFEQWWVFEDSEEGELLDPDLDRNQPYVLVLAFYSQEKSYWVKRIYYGVTARSEPIESGDAMSDNKTLRAERRVQVKGLSGEPSLLATLSAVALWITGGVETIAYTYDFSTEAWTSTAAIATSVMGINEGGVGVPANTDWYLQIGTTPVLWLESGETRMESLRAMNDFELPEAGGDRVEIRLDATRYLVAMASGEVIVRQVQEIAAVSTRVDDIIIRDAGEDWKATLRPGGIRCETLTEGAI